MRTTSGQKIIETMFTSNTSKVCFKIARDRFQETVNQDLPYNTVDAMVAAKAVSMMEAYRKILGDMLEEVKGDKLKDPFTAMDIALTTGYLIGRYADKNATIAAQWPTKTESKK